MGAKPRKAPRVPLLEELAKEMRGYLDLVDHFAKAEYNPFKLKVMRGKREATEHWLARIDALKERRDA